jgi:uncharacterized membrane protein YphA (DoxX/SURF4 family)
MRRFKILITSAISFLSFFELAGVASAHEAYVLPYDTFWSDVHESLTGHAFTALKNPNNLRVTAIIAVSVWIALGLNFWFRRSDMGFRFHAYLERFAFLGEHFIRITIAIAFLFSAWGFSFLGPELHGNLLPYGRLIQIALVAIGIMIGVGFLTELAALIGIIIFVVSFFVFGPYVFTYLNYLGELIVLLLFGLRSYSFDKYLFGRLNRLQNLQKYATVIVRIFYGTALLYAAITVKLLHPDLTVLVVKTYNLTQFHLLFPSDPLLVTLGAGIVEAVIGIFIIVGFQMRLTVLISLFYITMSLLFFREMVWPHLLLYGISFNLLVQPETFTLDKLLFGRRKSLTK